MRGAGGLPHTRTYPLPQCINSCSDCPLGYHDHDKNASTLCTLCPAGSYGVGSTCIKCDLKSTPASHRIVNTLHLILDTGVLLRPGYHV